MKKSFIYTVICCILFLSACRSDEKDILHGDTTLAGAQLPPAMPGVVKGMIRVKLTRETGNRFTIRETARETAQQRCRHGCLPARNRRKKHETRFP